MQSDTTHFSAHGDITKISSEADKQESPSKSFQCTECLLNLKSKVYLFEHLNKVHGLDVDSSLRAAGLKFAESNNTNSENGRNPGKTFKCPGCDFKTKKFDHLKKHKKWCQKSEKPCLERSDTKLSDIPTEEPKADHSHASGMSTSKAKCTPNSSKDLKTYKRPLETITKYFTVLSGSNKGVNIENESKETVTLEDEMSDCSPKTSGVFKVSGGIDITSRGGGHNFLQSNQLWSADLRESKPKKQSKEEVNNTVNEKNHKSLECPPAKKTKLEQRPQAPSENVNVHLSGSTDFSFEVSDEDEEKKVTRVNGDPQNHKKYFCKHCDKSHTSFNRIVIHYQNDHPYVRCTAAYIQTSHDQSATFRCFECPVEFSSTVDLKWHYSEKHPEAPDIFKVKLNELSLNFKCFTCFFTCKDLKDLMEHYKQKHPACKLDNSLLFCQYSACTSEEELAPMTSENSPDEAGLQDIFPQKASAPCTAVKETPLDYRAPKTGKVLYRCNECEFEHQSAVVMNVHYQKKHPEKSMSIDKIKHLGHSLSKETLKVNSKPFSVQNKTDKIEISPLKRIQTSLFKHTHVSKDPSKFEKSKHKKPAKKGIEKKKLISNDNKGINGGLGPLSSDASQEIPEDASLKKPKDKLSLQKETEDNIKNNFDIMEKNVQIQSRPEMVKRIRKIRKAKSWSASKVSKKPLKDFDDAEKLFFCQFCNFACPSLKGILAHQCYTHGPTNPVPEYVLKHTASVRDKINKSKSQGLSPSSPTYLPLPILNKGDKNLYFCNLCNYRKETIVLVLKHYSKRHASSVDKADDIRRYTSLVYGREQKSPQEATDIRVLEEKTKKKSENKDAQTESDAAPLSLPAPKTRRLLKCPICSYNTQYVFLLKSHLRKTHNSNRSVKQVLQLCFLQGAIESGYHCQWCVFSSKKANAVFNHYREEHPTLTVSLEQVKTRLSVCDLTQSAKKKEGKAKPDDPEPVPQSEDKTHSCTVCSFKSNSESAHKFHCDTFHPSSTKKDSSDSSKDKKSAKSQLEELSEMPGLFESFQVPIDHTDQPNLSVYLKCSYCPAVFSSPRGLNVHCGVKHVEAINAEMLKKQVKLSARVPVFKCGYCSYINTSHQGVSTHCHMKHPEHCVKVDSLHVDPAHVQRLDEYNTKRESGETLKFCGHLCDSCPQICTTLDKLKKHCEQKHIPNKEASEPHLETSNSPSKDPLSSFKCKFCSHVCSTTLGLDKHMKIKHFSALSKENIYKCVLCQQMCFFKNQLAKHYRKTHGRFAYAKYFLTPHKFPKKQASKSQNQKSVQREPDKVSSSKRVVYKCPSCPYVNSRHHGTLTHCQMRHPDKVVRADKLETADIALSDIVECSGGRALAERGYKCNKCSLIFASVFRLKIHCQREHGKLAASELLSGSEDNIQPEKSSQPVSTPKAASSENKTAPAEGLLFECKLCSYSGQSRKYLQFHYRKIHKLDAADTYVMLAKYNKRKRYYLAHHAKIKQPVGIKCIQCPDESFDSPQSLIAHYGTFHEMDKKCDFKILSFGVKKNSTGLYRCGFCFKELKGIKLLLYHVNRHKENIKANNSNSQKTSSADTMTETTEPIEQEPAVECKEEESAEGLIPPSTPQPPSSKLCEAETEGKEEQHPCTHCLRTFKSRKSLRIHERGHAVMAAINKLDNLPASDLKNNLKKYVFHKGGTSKPFRCSCCPYRTNLMGLWRSHFLKNHQDVIQKYNVETDNEEKIKINADKDILGSLEKNDDVPELDEEADEKEESYSEPPDVQRQLNHYSFVAQTMDKNNARLPKSHLHCEMCNFNTEHLSRMRRHYLTRHGKKVFRCKDCDFFTGSRKTLEMHSDVGHATCQSEPTHQRDLCCPFCLYQTRNKNNMIDHIVLHREERVVPIEVRRPKLSRYLQGIVFRCHKCTFMSSSAESLRLHVMRHEDVKPYKCRLCYFDCPRLCELEAHLSDKHQVLRNHELVGQVSLEQLKARMENGPEKMDDYISDSEVLDTQKLTGSDDDQQSSTTADDGSWQEPVESVNETKEMQDRHKDYAKNSLPGIHSDAAQLNTTGLQTLERDMEKNAALDTREGQHALNAEECEDLELQEEKCNNREENIITDDDHTTLTEVEEENASDESSSVFDTSGNTQSSKLQVKGGRSNIGNTEAKLENEMVQSELLKDTKTHKNAKLETKTNLDLNISAEKLILDKKSTLIQNLRLQLNTKSASATANAESAQVANTHSQRELKLDRRLLTLWSRGREDFPLEAYKLKKEEIPTSTKNASEPVGEIPADDDDDEQERKARLKECEEEEGQKHEEEDEVDRHQGSPHVQSGAAKDEVAEVRPKEKVFTCDLCGRILPNMSELNRHVMRHGL